MGDDPESVRRKKLLFRAGIAAPARPICCWVRSPNGISPVRCRASSTASRRCSTRIDAEIYDWIAGRARRAARGRQSTWCEMLLKFHSVRDERRPGAATGQAGKPRRCIAGAPEGHDALVLGGLVADGQRSEAILHVCRDDARMARFAAGAGVFPSRNRGADLPGLGLPALRPRLAQPRDRQPPHRHADAARRKAGRAGASC